MKELILILLLINFALSFLILDLLNRSSYVVFLNVGQGNSVLIYNPKLQILYDTGPQGFKIISSLNKFIPFYDRTIDVVILSHLDKDHYGGTFSILERFNVRLFIVSPIKTEETTYQILLNKIKELNIPLITLKSGDKIETNYEKILILNPEIGKFKTDNQNSVVLKIYKNNKTFLLTGDIDQKVEKYLINKYGELVSSDYLLIPHHGSKYSSSYEFLKITGNIYSIIQVGPNKYGHPHNEVIERLKSLKKKYWRTDLQGELIVQ